MFCTFAINNFKNDRKIYYKKPVKYVISLKKDATKPSESTANGVGDLALAATTTSFLLRTRLLPSCPGGHLLSIRGE
jgi:hypothetical protein